jgi:hypothetical protein
MTESTKRAAKRRERPPATNSHASSQAPSRSSVDVRVSESSDEQAVAIHTHLGRSRVSVLVTATSPAWVPAVRLPEGLMLDEAGCRRLVWVTRLAFRTFHQNFRGPSVDSQR